MDLSDSVYVHKSVKQEINYTIYEMAICLPIFWQDEDPNPLDISIIKVMFVVLPK